jgi:pimeloyl-ACP methyl ester carboxylesterase
MHPYDRSGNITTKDRVRNLSGGMEAYISSQEASSGTKMDSMRRERLLDNDHEALIAAISAPRGIPGIEETITKLPMPCMLYVGEADAFHPGVEEASKVIPGVAYASFPGLDHGQVSMRSDVVLPPVTEFLSSVVQQTAVAD